MQTNFEHLPLVYAGVYDPWLVSLSIVVTMFASYAALLVSRFISSNNLTQNSRRLWLAGGSLCLGTGIWAMHFIGMLAFSLPCTTRYATGLSLLSTLPGFMASLLALNIISRPEPTRLQLCVGGGLIGAGIGAMHYAGMAAMRFSGVIRYDFRLFVLSLLVAMLLATGALWLCFRLKRERWSIWVNSAGAVVMGLAVSGMHYTAMAAAWFVRDETGSTIVPGMSSVFLASIVLIATCLLIVMTIFATVSVKPSLLSFGRSFRLIGLLIAVWFAIAWLSADYHQASRAGEIYQQELLIAGQQTEHISGDMDGIVTQLKGIAQMISREAVLQNALLRYAKAPDLSKMTLAQRKNTLQRFSYLSELNNELAIVSDNLQGDNIFVLDAQGDCIAAANADQPATPLGRNFVDRAYFAQLRVNLPSYQYAVGKTSNIPGLYYAYPATQAGHFIGAVVVKREIRKFSSLLNQGNAFLSDVNGVIILASDKQLELKSLPESTVMEMSVSKRLLQYQRSTIEPLRWINWDKQHFPSALLITGSGQPVVIEAKALQGDALKLHIIRKLEGMDRLTTEKYWIFLLLSVSGSLLILTSSSLLFYFREAQRSASELRIAATAFESSEGIFIVDANGVILRVNQAFTRITGYSQQQAVGKNASLLKSSLHDALFYSKMWESIRNTDCWQGELWNKRANGELFAEYLSVTAIRDKGGLITHYVSMFNDITERKKYQEELARSNSDLEQFSYAVSHDMRQPLRMISSYLQLIEMDQKKNPLHRQMDAEHLRYLGIAIDGAKRIDQMLAGLLEYSRSGRGSVAPVLIETRQVLEEALQFLKPDLRDVELRVTGEWPHLRAVHDEILSVMQNLIGNAIKYRVAGRAPQIRVSGRCSSVEWHFCVEDNGVGIEPEQMHRLFKVFQRLHSRKEFAGTGIGLALCRKIVQQYNGRIWAESAGSKQGSRFFVMLPLL